MSLDILTTGDLGVGNKTPSEVKGSKTHRVMKKSFKKRSPKRNVGSFAYT